MAEAKYRTKTKTKTKTKAKTKAKAKAEAGTRGVLKDDTYSVHVPRARVTSTELCAGSEGAR